MPSSILPESCEEEISLPFGEGFLFFRPRIDECQIITFLRRAFAETGGMGLTASLLAISLLLIRMAIVSLPRRD